MQSHIDGTNIVSALGTWLDPFKLPSIRFPTKDFLVNNLHPCQTTDDQSGLSSPALEGMHVLLGYRGAIIAATAFGSEELKQSWFQQGCNELLEKPLLQQDLIRSILQHVLFY